MASLYSKIIADPKKISLTDIFFSSKKAHTSADMDYALVAGTSLDTVHTEIGMLQKWEQPWLYRRVLLVGLLLSLSMIGAVGIMILLTGLCIYPALTLLMIMIPPCIVPITLMFFFWEMNAPRDISLPQMLGYFFTGGVLSLLLTTLLLLFFPNLPAPAAPLTEEPAKLLATLFFLHRLQQKNGKVYGFSGLALGAAVGAGFAAFESAQYACQQLPLGWTMLGTYEIQANIIIMDQSSFWYMLFVIGLRCLCALCSHVLYCAPYACIAALNMENKGSVWSSMGSLSFWVVFILSCLCHAVWNFGFSFLPSLAVIGTILWASTLYTIRRSFGQLVQQVRMSGSSTRLTALRIQGLQGVHAGVAFSITRPEILIGSDPSCQLLYPVNLTDIAPRHGKLVVKNGGLYLADLGTQSGITLNGTRLSPLTGYLLKSGDRFSLGSSGQDFYVI